jgi:uncharacterized repeat protein (TIGR03843 family)
MPEDQRPPPTRTLSLLATGTVDIEGRMPWSSNGTFLCTVETEPGCEPDPAATSEFEGQRGLHAIYKPRRTERDLWDFPGGLYRREVAAYVLAEALGWDMVPETIERADVPLGIGSLQRFVDADFEHHYFTLLEDEQHHPALQRMAVFDAVANNADRKGGHCLIDATGHIWGIDHGLCFHAEPKLRTVIWDWAGEPIDDALLAPVDALAAAGPGDALTALLEPDEVDALIRRARRLVSKGRYPDPRSERPYPWPLV